MCERHYRLELQAQAAPCSQEGCVRPVRARGLCHPHYQRHLETLPRQTCAVPRCNRQVAARGLCRMDYRRWVRLGRAEARECDWRPSPEALATVRKFDVLVTDPGVINDVLLSLVKCARSNPRGRSLLRGEAGALG